MRLYLSDAIEFVRARMDELSYNNDDMIVPADDDRNFDTTVEKLLPEAAEFIFRAAPARLLEPQDAVRQDSADVESHSLKEDGSLVITIDLSGGFLRLVSFKSDDSDIYVTQTVPFDGPSARMQANLYVRGTWDDPVLVERKVPGKLELRYYSVRNSEVEPGFGRQEHIQSGLPHSGYPQPPHGDGAGSLWLRAAGPGVLSEIRKLLRIGYDTAL